MKHYLSPVPQLLPVLGVLLALLLLAPMPALGEIVHEWTTGEWGDCDADDCLQYRDVTCVEVDMETHDEAVVDDALCSTSGTRPRDQRPCDDGPSCSDSPDPGPDESRGGGSKLSTGTILLIAGGSLCGLIAAAISGWVVSRKCSAGSIARPGLGIEGASDALLDSVPSEDTLDAGAGPLVSGVGGSRESRSRQASAAKEHELKPTRYGERVSEASPLVTSVVTSPADLEAGDAPNAVVAVTPPNAKALLPLSLSSPTLTSSASPSLGTPGLAGVSSDGSRARMPSHWFSPSSTSRASGTSATGAGAGGGQGAGAGSPAQEGRMATTSRSGSSAMTPYATRGSVTWDLRRVTLDDFDPICVLGEGSFGRVTLVRSKETKTVFAMKVLRKQLVKSQGQIVRTKAERFVLEKLSHPFIVKLHATFQTPTKLFFVLDYHAGGDVYFHLTRRGHFDSAACRFYAAEMVLALEYLHARGILYRDLKPENVLLSADGHVVLTDFGLCKDLEDGMQEQQQQQSRGGGAAGGGSARGGAWAHSFVGTAEYLAPEVVTGQPYGPSCDWYGLGVTLYEMATGQPPFYHTDKNKLYYLVLHATPEFPYHVEDDLCYLILALLERNPQRRLGSRGDGAEVKKHPFFRGVDWDAVYRKALAVPFVPVTSPEHALSAANFEPEFTKMPVYTKSSSDGGAASSSQSAAAAAAAQSATQSANAPKSAAAAVAMRQGTEASHLIVRSTSVGLPADAAAAATAATAAGAAALASTSASGSLYDNCTMDAVAFIAGADQPSTSSTSSTSSTGARLFASAAASAAQVAAFTSRPAAGTIAEEAESEADADGDPGAECAAFFSSTSVRSDHALAQAACGSSVTSGPSDVTGDAPGDVASRAGDGFPGGPAISVSSTPCASSSSSSSSSSSTSSSSSSSSTSATPGSAVASSPAPTAAVPALPSSVPPGRRDHSLDAATDTAMVGLLGTTFAGFSFQNALDPAAYEALYGEPPETLYGEGEGDGEGEGGGGEEDGEWGVRWRGAREGREEGEVEEGEEALQAARAGHSMRAGAREPHGEEEKR